MQMQQQSVLPPATKLFLDSLKAGAKLQAPNGQPTVAAQAAQSAGIIPQQQQPQQGGTPPVTPEEEQQGLAGILDQLKQAQQTGPSVAQNQQQAQQQQLAQQAAQMVPQQGQQPQQMAEGGLAGLPVNMGEFAEGGVIGYAGPEGSEVDAEEATSDIGNFLRSISGGITDMVGRANQGMERVRGRYNAQIMPYTAATPSERAESARQMALYATPETPKQPKQPDAAEAAAREMIPSHPTEEAFLAAQEKQAQSEQPAEAGGSNLKFNYAPNTNIAKVINVLRAEMARVPSSAEKAQLSAEIDRLHGQLPAPVPAPVPDGGLGALAQPSAQREETPATHPSLSGIMTDMQSAGFTKPNLSEQQRLYDAQKKHFEDRPDFGAQQIATANKIHDLAQSQDERQRQLLQASVNPLIRGGGTRMAGVTADFERAVAGRDAAHLQFIDAAKEAEYNRQTGALDKLAESQAKMDMANQKYQEFSAQLAGHMYSSQAGITQAQLMADSRRDVAEERVRGLINTAEARLAGKSPEDLRAAQIDRYTDDYNKLFLDMMAKQDLKAQGINSLQDYIKYRDFLKTQKVGTESGNATPPAVQAALSKYGVK